MMASKKKLKRKINNLIDENKALEQSHKQYQDLFAKIMAMMVDELGVDIVQAIVDDHAPPFPSGIALGKACKPSGGHVYCRDGKIVYG